MIEHVATGVLGVGRVPPDEVLRIEGAVFERNLLPQVASINDFDLYCAISHFLLLVSGSLGIDVQNDEMLVEALLSHVKSIVDWDSEPFQFVLNDASGTMANMVRSAAESHFHVLERYLHRSMDEGMRASIAVHICAALYRREGAMEPCRVLIACPGSMATCAYLEAQVKSCFHFEVVGRAAVRSLTDDVIEKCGADFVVSTAPVEGVSVPVAVVAPVLTVDDINRILSYAFACRRSEVPIPAPRPALIEALSAVYALGDRRKTAFLDRKLAEVLEAVQRIEFETARDSLLVRMLETRFIRVEQREIPWREAMCLASDELVRNGFFASSYVQKAIRNVEDFGTYIVVNEGIALAHAGNEDGVFKDGLGLLTSGEGIVFDGGERVYLLFFFSQKSDIDYLDLFKEIIRLGANQGRGGLQRIRAARSPQDVRQALIEMLSDYGDQGE